MMIHEILQIKYPIIQGGMANIATGEFAAAVSNAGGLGLIATGGVDAERLREEIRICRKLTDKKFGVNFPGLPAPVVTTGTFSSTRISAILSDWG